LLVRTVKEYLTMIMFCCAGLRQTSGRYFLGFIILSILLPILLTTHVKAEVAGPGWFAVEAEPVSPEEAEAYFDSKRKGLTAQASSTITSLNASSTEITDEITALARALQHDPKLIYEFVRNNIDYVSYFGSLKGATLTLLERSGNDFDQASLMIALLRASGFTAQYVYGQMTIPSCNAGDNYDIQHWLGVDADSSVIARVLSSGGIPATVSHDWQRQLCL